ncbi:MAG: peptidylprolyl isomerase [Roseibacillus sp.]|nr:peptidylprolyl isomerase [Roseibacillus sp.]MBQ63861.1 peptidylprolyl isomerase [Euryarchaeota archaeon]HAO96444.1 peptidylprolyl isomerase [Verrucomicrobiales bacterium]|tara:strand:- start:1311 stop:1841 length:531 start_codon:yes stop_codon:yes gene_type:complete
MDDTKITLNTSKGAIDISLFSGDTPITCASFLNLAKKGFYDGLIFHRVIKDFMIQGGCPEGSGRGNPGYQFENECLPHRSHDSAGKLSMANAGPNTNGSQFFITHTATQFLDGKHTVFGEVTGGQEVVDAIATATTGPGDRPAEDITIDSVTIHDSTEDLFEAQKSRIADWNAAMA